VYPLVHEASYDTRSIPSNCDMQIVNYLICFKLNRSGVTLIMGCYLTLDLARRFEEMILRARKSNIARS
jgi:hypothetical protein